MQTWAKVSTNHLDWLTTVFMVVIFYFHTHLFGGIQLDTHILLEIFGYLGSFLVVISMTMRNVIKLRILNMCGSVISTTYSIIVGAWPIVAMNVAIFSINLYHIITEKIHANKGLAPEENNASAK